MNAIYNPLSRARLLSVRPVSNLAICAQRLPTSAWARSTMASSSAVNGFLFREGSS